MVLPEGFVLPPLPYAVLLTVGAGVALGLLWRAPPSVTPGTVLALVPWMALGGAAHVVWVLGLGPSRVRHLLATPAVYVTVAVLAGLCWGVGNHVSTDESKVDGLAGVVGALASLAVIGWLAAVAARGPGLHPLWPVAGILGTLVLTGVLWYCLRLVAPAITETTGWAGLVVLFGHTLDGVTTAIGIDILGTGERSPLPDLIMSMAGQLPTAPYLGVGWAFVVVKIVLVIGILWLFLEYVREAPPRAYLLLAVMAAVGLGPGIHNAVLFLHLG